MKLIDALGAFAASAFLIMALSAIEANAGELKAFGGIYAFNDNVTKYEYTGLSPFGYFGIKWEEPVSDRVSFSVGLKHQSSMMYREPSGGFNGVFADMEITLWK